MSDSKLEGGERAFDDRANPTGWPGAELHGVRAQVADTLGAVEGLDLAWCAERG